MPAARWRSSHANAACLIASDLSDYARKGDLAAPFVRSKKADRAQEKARQLHDWMEQVVAKAPPLSPEARDKIAALLGPVADRSKPPMMRWQLRRYCGDVVEQTADAKYLNPDEAFKDSEQCPACGRKPSIVVDAEPVGLVSSN